MKYVATLALLLLAGCARTVPPAPLAVEATQADKYAELGPFLAPGEKVIGVK